MTTLAKRATPAQRQIMRVVRGAVKNAADAHPHWNIPPKFANSVAKRAAGTLTALGPDVLAALSAPSDRGGGQYETRHPATALAFQPSRRGALLGLPGRSPLQTLWQDIRRQLWRLKREDPARAAVLVDVLRQIAALQRKR